MLRRSSMRRVRRGKSRGSKSGYIVTWDVDSADHVSAGRLRRFIFGDSTRSNGRIYRYAGFVEKDGVRYLGQSVLFVKPSCLQEIENFLANNGIDHEVTQAILG